eukprot:TRINITY_DN9586_c0_g1_i2.p1 TRINITY_DN9586_c0_g1~~TRINITY_DN9586_c0_g1_i2.p1  ORF type:complete len:270 (+),score=56.55 TRINITY_DN9586_c0_g1_i2:165-974(+)
MLGKMKKLFGRGGGQSSPTIYDPIRLVLLGLPGSGKTALVQRQVHGIFLEAYNPTPTQEVGTASSSTTKPEEVSVVETTKPEEAVVADTTHDNNNNHTDDASHSTTTEERGEGIGGGEDTYWKEFIIDGHKQGVHILNTEPKKYATTRDHWCRSGQCFLLVFSITSRATFLELNVQKEYLQKMRELEDASNISIVICGCKADLEDQREVTQEEAQTYARSIGAPYIETSAKDDKNVTEAFHTVIRRHRNTLASSSSSSSSSSSLGQKVA